MATIINNPGESESSGVGFVIGILAALVLLGLFLVYGLPALRNSDQPNNANIKVELPNPIAPTPPAPPPSNY